jgi:hypothetical protein
MKQVGWTIVSKNTGYISAEWWETKQTVLRVMLFRKQTCPDVEFDILPVFVADSPHTQVPKQGETMRTLTDEELDVISTMLDSQRYLLLAAKAPDENVRLDALAGAFTRNEMLAKLLDVPVKSIKDIMAEVNAMVLEELANKADSVE